LLFLENYITIINDVLGIVDGAENFSDHCPLILETDVYLCCRKSVVCSQSSKFKVDCFRWDIADCSQYYLLTYNRFNCIQAPLFLLDNVSAINYSSDYILSCINQYYHDIVNTFFEFSCDCVPPGETRILLILVGRRVDCVERYSYAFI